MLSELLLAAEDFGSYIISLDKEWLLAVNGSDSLYLDHL